MHVMILASNADMGRIWARHLQRQGAEVTLVTAQDDAVNVLRHRQVDVLVADIVLEEGSAIAVADFANYRQPATKVVLVSNSGFFSDGSVFAHVSNVCTMVPQQIEPANLGAVVEYYART